MQVVRAVAIRADRRIQFMLLQQRDAVDALLVTHDRAALAQMKLLHLGRVAVASPAGIGEIRAIHGRGGVAVVEQFVRIPVAILAGRCFRHALVNRLAVIAFQIDVRLDPVTLAATDGLEVLRMRHIRDVGMTTRTEVLCVDRVGELLLINEQRNGLARRVGLGQRLVGVADETVGVLDGLDIDGDQQADGERPAHVQI